MANRRSVNRQVRGFAFAWTGVTLVIGMAAFVSIYLAYGATDEPPNQMGVALPAAETEAPQVAAQTTPVPTVVPPTALPTATNTPERSIAVAQADTNPTATSPPATPLPINDTGFHAGIQVQYSITFNSDFQRGWFNDVRGMGLDWFKQQVRWEDIEKEPGVYDWAKLDLTLPLASELGMKALLSVVTAPDWTREPGVNLEEEGPPADPQAFANFLTAMLQRYPGMIHAIEVWNEQNIVREWTTSNGLNAGDYVMLLQTAYTTIKNIDPGIIVISGALSPGGGWSEEGVTTAVDDFVFMDQLIAAGMLNYTDCVGAHHNGYNISPSVTWDAVPDDPTATYRGPFDNPHHSWSFRSTLQTYADKIAVAGGDQKLCVTEFGWATVEDLEGPPRPGFEFAIDNTLEEQAEWTVEALNNMEEWGIVWIATIWNLNYAPQAGFDPGNDNTAYSFLGPNGQRPVMAAVRAWGMERVNQ